MHSELKRIKEQVATQEKEFGSKDYVLSEFARRRKDFERAEKEVGNSQRSLKVKCIKDNKSHSIEHFIDN